MRQFSCALLLALISLTAYSQKVMPVIKQGTVINYTFHLHGQQSAFAIEVKSITDTLALRWTIRNLAGGVYLISPAGWNQGSKMNFAQPVPNTAVKLSPDQTFCMISKSAFKDLLEKHQFTYDNTVYDLKEDAAQNTVMLENQPVDVLHVTAENETTELWILNNPNFPFICQIKGNPLGIDVDLNSIKPY
jgi:hypothetical protein